MPLPERSVATNAIVSKRSNDTIFICCLTKRPVGHCRAMVYWPIGKLRAEFMKETVSFLRLVTSGSKGLYFAVVTIKVTKIVSWFVNLVLIPSL